MSECIVFFATAWGSHYGGINSFNYDLCKALAKLTAPSLSVVCIVEDDIVEDEDKDKLSGLEIWSLPTVRSSKQDIDNVVDKLKSRQLTAVYVIGHDVHTGPRAIAVSKHLNVPVAVFHHMDYRAYKPFQGKNDKEQLDNQRNILKEANIVFAIGPKLENSAKDKIRGREEAVRVIKVQPGLAEIKPVKMPLGFSAITFGRVNRENTLLKQIDLAVASFGRAAGNEAKPLGEDPGIVVIGLSEEELDTEYKLLKSLVEKYARRAVSIYGWSYDNNRDNLFEELKGHSVCMMLSIHEGFGLVGLEAISAGVPLILSKNTGLYNAITQPPPDGLGITYPYSVEISGSFSELQSKDIEEVVKHLYAIATNKDEAKRKAIELREKLYECWTWENVAHQVIREFENILKSPPTSDTFLPNKSKFESRSEPDQINSEIVPVEQKPSETEEQVIDPLTQEIPVLEVVVDQPIIPKQQVPELKKEINALNKDIQHCLRSLRDSELKRILAQDSPFPQLFEKIDYNSISLKDILIRFKAIIKKCNGSSDQVVLVDKAYKLANISCELLDKCFQEISLLKECSSRKTNSYAKALGNVKHLFNQIEQNLVELGCYLEKSLFL
jgi:glycosyltransferase involved in cell wall biosynthesis